MFWQGELSGYRRLSEDSEGVQVLGLGEAESCSELLGWSSGGLLPDSVVSELLPDGIVSEHEGLEWGGIV